MSVIRLCGELLRMTCIPSDYIPHMGDSGQVQCALCGSSYVEGGPFKFTKCLELCRLHLASVVTGEAVP
jgi:hypothetical protein